MTIRAGIFVFAERESEELPGDPAQDHPFDAREIDQSMGEGRLHGGEDHVQRIVENDALEMAHGTRGLPSVVFAERFDEWNQLRGQLSNQRFLGGGRLGRTLRTPWLLMFRLEDP